MEKLETLRCTLACLQASGSATHTLWRWHAAGVLSLLHRCCLSWPLGHSCWDTEGTRHMRCLPGRTQHSAECDSRLLPSLHRFWPCAAHAGAGAGQARAGAWLPWSPAGPASSFAEAAGVTGGLSCWPQASPCLARWRPHARPGPMPGASRTRRRAALSSEPAQHHSLHVEYAWAGPHAGVSLAGPDTADVSSPGCRRTQGRGRRGRRCPEGWACSGRSTRHGADWGLPAQQAHQG